MKKMTDAAMRKAEGGYFRRGVKAYMNGRWQVVYNGATELPSWSSWANCIRREANAIYAEYSAWGYRCKFF